MHPWGGGPPTSGNSTPLRENIPESPTDGFPDFGPQSSAGNLAQNRRARAGTVPSRFSPGDAGVGTLGVPTMRDNNLATKTTRPTPSHSPFQSPSPGLISEEQASIPNSTVLLSRLRAGSMPQRSPFVPGHFSGTSSPFGPGVFSTGWNPTGRERGATLASIASVGSNGPSSPAQSQYSREGTGENDAHMRTLDYLGLAETPQPARAQLATPSYISTYNPDFSRAANRFRSYSVNNKDRYADEDDDEFEAPPETEYEKLQKQIAETQYRIHTHNMTVHALANQAALTNRPRARTAGVLDTPPSRTSRPGHYYPTPSRLDNSITAAEVRLPDEKDYDDIPHTVAAVAAMNLGRSNSRNNGNGLLIAEEQGLEGPTSALWLGGIPTSTTITTLNEWFKKFGPIVSSRVLTHKNCGFVNFERVDSAIAAKSEYNGTEIFPGAGPIRINFAKPPSASNTPGHDGVFPSPSPDPFAKGRDSGANGSGTPAGDATPSLTANVEPTVPPLDEMTDDILQISKEFGATEEGLSNINTALQRAINYTEFIGEIPPIREPAHTRSHDAPKLRDIRKRIDNQALSRPEIERIAQDMLPEIAELASDYLGNTVVQKLFENCSDDIRDMMLAEIAPHMAEIGCHKNGTWAAQRIIDQCKTPHQASLLARHLHPYTVPLFQDQYGNYVLQGMLKFGAPHTDFIFDTMLSRMWEIAQGRFGARAMRACLESHFASKDQQRMLAAAIALHSVQLATNTNGALLLTWFLDTCTFPQRRTVLSPQLVPHLVHLCTHKVAFLTVLKVINQKPEGDARDTILKALFFSKNDQVLEAILNDPGSGAAMIFKVLTTPFYDEAIRSQIVEKVKAVLVRVKADRGTGGYKRLMDEIGLSSRGGGGGGARDHGSSSNDRTRPSSRQTGSLNTPQLQLQQSHHQQHQGQQQQQQQDPQAYTPQAQHAQMASQYSVGNGQFYAPQNPGAAPGMEFGYGIQRSDSVEPPLIPQFSAFGAPGAMYNAGGPALAPSHIQQMHYQSMMSRTVAPMNNAFSSFPASFGGYPSSGPSIDQYRGQNLVNGSPVPPQTMPGQQQSPFAAPGFGVPMGMNGYSYGGGMNGMQNGPYMPDQGNNHRRGHEVGHNRQAAALETQD
jgi:protein JSN1